VTLYVYALVEQRLAPVTLGRGIARLPLSLVRAGGAYAVVESAEAHEPTPAAIRAHDRVVRRIARAARAVLPMRFASTVATSRELDEALAVLPVARAFDRVRDAVQFTLRVRGVGEPKRAKSRRGVGPGTRWLTDRFARQSVPELAPVTEATRAWVRETRSERRPPSDAVVYYLVAREHVRAWRVALKRALAALPIDVTATGPWPPYAFAELT
jgi:hypothetical protein